MALKDIFSLFDDKLSDVFKQRKYDPADDRAKLVKRLESTKSKFLAAEPPRGKKDFQVANNVVAYSPILPGGQPMILDGKPTNHIPAERFAEVLDKLIAEVEGGALDKELEAAAKGKVGESAELPKVRKARRSLKADGGGDPVYREPGTGSRAWSDERRAKFAASIAARNAAK